MTETSTPGAPRSSRGDVRRRPRRRTVVGLGVAAALLLAAVLVIGPRLYAASQEDRAAAPLATSTPAAAAPTAAAVDPTLDGDWTVTGGTAGYRVDEVLNGQEVTVTGRTERVEGALTVEGGQLTEGLVEVDLASVTTDSSQRDREFAGIVGVDANPTATFDVTGPVALGGLEEEGGTVAVTLPGTLTINGTPRPVQVPATATRTSAAEVTVTGEVPVTWADHGVQAPDLGFVAVEPAGSLEFQVSAAAS